MLVTASWGGAEVAVEVDAECRSVAALKRCLQEALPDLDMEAVCLDVCGRTVDDEGVLGLAGGSVIDVSATQAALAAAALREEGRTVDFNGFRGAAVQGNVRLCSLYLEAGVVWPPGVGSPLHIAARNDYRELLELLVDAGCDIDAKDRRGDTPLHEAISQENIQLAKFLVDADCDKDAKNKYGDTPLHDAVSKNNVHLVKLLLDAGCDADAKDASTASSPHGRWGVARKHLHGCDVDAKNKYGNSPLHDAISKDNVHLVKLLVDAGCNVDAKNQYGIAPLDEAVSSEDIQLIKLLLDAGCDKEAKTQSGRTPLHAAVSEGNMQLVKLLLDAGCDKEAKTKVGHTPLQIAILKENAQLVQLLVDAGCLQDEPAERNLPSSHARPSAQAGRCVLC